MAQMEPALTKMNIGHLGFRPDEVPHLLGGTPRGYSRTRETLGHDAPLTTTQQTLHEPTVQKYRENPDHSPIDVVHHEGEYFLMEGHHRAVASRMEGRPIEATVYRKKTR